MVDYSFPDVINISIHFIMKLKKKIEKKKSNQEGMKYVDSRECFKRDMGSIIKQFQTFFFLRVIFNAFMSLNDGWEDWRS